MRRQLLGIAVGTVLALGVLVGGCGGEESSANKQANREFDICMEQADEIASTQGSDAASDHLDQCVDSYANEAQVEP